MFQDSKALLTSLFNAAVLAADPSLGMKANLPARPKGRTVVVGAGKASAQMARALELLWDGPLTGVVVTRYGFACETKSIKILEAAHPVPDRAGLVAGRALLEVIKDLTPEDLVIALVSGGGSALLPAPPPSLSLSDELEVNRTLLASGAPIAAMNIVRKHVSSIKGGRLAASTKARVVTFVVSDIPGDDVALVATGPTIPDETTRHDALDVAAQYRLNLPARVLEHLRSPAADAPKPSDGVFSRNVHHIVASARISLKAASELAISAGFRAVILSDAIEGQSRDIASMHGSIAREVLTHGEPFERPVILFSGGETTVTLGPNPGLGGRNTEFALAAAIALRGLDVHLLAADTDGIDGSGINAGAFADGTTVGRIVGAGLDPTGLLGKNDSYNAFEAIGDLFVPGPTGTNVNDFRAFIIK
ncbi:glycerate kinase [Rhizobium sp. BE258]|uniref:glycerate kinase type-2 family protein n=1 Tax=Rhizobium sp. BE258 TaxID=2817722 RepID=UPI000DD5CEA0|nr:glycerate kinase [Rhizobium sp. BE258]